MSFSVTKMAPTLVSPAAATPSGHLPFSAEDRMLPPGFLVPVVLVFRQGKKHMAAKVIREAVAKALVPYYPVAGRTAADPDDGELGIACTGEGVWFVEASADCRLEGLGDVNLYVQEQALFDLSKDQLLPSPPHEVDQNAFTFTMQVTEFKCGGFTVGIKFSHAMFDGNGAGQFMVAIGEMARGLPKPTVKPVWYRDVIPRLSPGPDPDEEPPTIKALQSYTTDLSLDRINQLKDNFEKETGGRCTTFDIVLAIFWQCRTRAIDQQPDADVCLTSAANVRGFLRDRLPPEGGYYGNCLNLITLKATAGQIANGSIFDIVRLVKEAKDNVEVQCSRWLKGIGGPPMPPSTYPNVLLIDWRRLGFFEADYGWGPPDYVVPLDGHPAVILNSPAPVKGIRLMTKCIAHEHFEAFRCQMSEWVMN